ncbi:MAG: hypothetical protein VCE74_13890, partial [Alphaproteobacteria bacterium]
MAAILTSLRNTVIAGVVLAVIMVIVLMQWHADTIAFDMAWATFFMRWLHVLCGVMWIGILWYFNFVQIPNMGKIPDDQKPAISKVIAPAALFWFRWAAMATIITGLAVGSMNGYIVEALSLGLTEGATGGHRLIGIGMWFGIIMWFNVWFIIWPNQKKALGIVDATADEKAAAA